VHVLTTIGDELYNMSVGVVQVVKLVLDISPVWLSTSADVVRTFGALIFGCPELTSLNAGRTKLSEHIKLMQTRNYDADLH
jgi:hypothetical protein